MQYVEAATGGAVVVGGSVRSPGVAKSTATPGRQKVGRWVWEASSVSSVHHAVAVPCEVARQW